MKPEDEVFSAICDIKPILVKMKFNIGCIAMSMLIAEGLGQALSKEDAKKALHDFTQSMKHHLDLVQKEKDDESIPK